MQNLIKTFQYQVQKRVEDVETMCQKHKSALSSQLAKLAMKREKEKLAIDKSRRSSGSSFANVSTSISNSTPSSQNSSLSSCELKSAKSTSQLDIEENWQNSGNFSQSSGNSQSTLSLDRLRGQSHGGQGSDEEAKVKMGHVLNELLQTERSYVEEIGEILAVSFKKIEAKCLERIECRDFYKRFKTQLF